MFHCEYSQLGDIRSVIPDEVHVIALTATATIETRSIIIRSLNMVKPLVVSLHPGKSNISYSVPFPAKRSGKGSG